MRLDEWLKQSRPLAERLRVIERLSQAVNEVHDRGEALGGLEPAAVEVLPDGSCDLSPARRGNTSPPYRAPERSSDGQPSAEADVYAAGAVFYEMLAGRPPGTKPKPLVEVRPEVPRDLADAIMGCLERAAEWRPKDLTYVAQVAAAQQAGSRGGGVPTRAPAPPRASRAGARPPARPRRQWPLAVAAVVLLAGAAAGGYFYLQQSGGVPTLASLTAPRRTPAPPPVAAPLPAANPTPAAPSPQAATPRATPPPTAAPTPGPRPTVAETRPSPTPAPRPDVVVPTTTPPPAASEVGEPTAAPVAAPPVAPAAVEPALLTAVSPLTVRRTANALLDIRGSGLRPEHKARLSRAKGPLEGLTVVRQRYVDSTLVKVLLNLEPTAPPGVYTVSLVDEAGVSTNALTFTVSK